MHPDGWMDGWMGGEMKKDANYGLCLWNLSKNQRR